MPDMSHNIEKGDWIKVVTADKKTDARQITEGKVTSVAMGLIMFGRLEANRHSTPSFSVKILEHRKPEIEPVEDGIYEWEWDDGTGDFRRYSSGWWYLFTGDLTIPDSERKYLGIRLVRRVKIVDWTEGQS